MKTKQSSTESSAEFDVASYREVLEGVKAEVQRLGMRVETIVESIEKLQASLDKVAISKVQPDDEHSTSEERKTETAPDDMNSRSCPCLSTEMELRSTEQDISNRILEKLDDLILVTQGFNKNLTPMNKYVRAKLACLRLDCFRLLCHAINDPKFEEQWVRWEIPIEYNQRDGTSRRRLPQPSPSWKKTTSFINILSEVDLDELSNGNLGQSDLKWLQDERIGFLEVSTSLDNL